MYNEQLEQLIEAALTDGVLTDKEKQVLFKKAESLGIDKDEFEMVLDARLVKAQQAQQPVHAAKEKLGNIVTCPNCGAQIPGGAAVCPECGYEFRNVEANLSVQKFSEGLQRIQRKLNESGSEECNSIALNYFTTFPVPNTADDLLEFLSFVQEPARKHDLMSCGAIYQINNILENAYWNLYSKCIAKAKVSFANDARFVPYIEHYEKKNKKMTPEAQKKIVRTLVIVSVIVLLIIFFGWIHSCITDLFY